MGNTRERARKTHRRLRDAFRQMFPRVQRTLQKAGHSPCNHRHFTLADHPPLQPGMSINVTVRFESPLQEVMTRTYNVTERFELNEDVIGALVRRIEHCTSEMITRPDAAADSALRHTDPRIKPARYHVLYQVSHDGEPVWDKYYTSYQHTAVTRDGANDIMFEVDRIIAMFLVHHDAGFVWHLPELRSKQPHTHKSTAPEVGKPQDTHCVPTFDESAYSIDVAMRTKINGRESLRVFKVDSEQSTPLTLQLGENMLSQLSSVIRNAMQRREDQFWEMHTACDGLEGKYGCRHVEDGALELIVRVKNNLGPDYNHLADRVQSHRHLVIPQEATPFLNYLQEQVEMVRGHFDELTNATEDLVITVHDLRSYNWMVNDPMKIVFDSSTCRDRTTVEKVLQRLQTGMFDVLKGHGTAAFVTAHKRGHLIMETTICRGEDIAFWDMGVFDNLHLKKRVLQERLRKRITQDLQKVCKDTIRLTPINGMAGIEVSIPAVVDVTALSEEARIRSDKIQRSNAKTAKSSAHSSRRRKPEELVGVAAAPGGRSGGQRIAFAPCTIFEAKGHSEGGRRPPTPMPDSESSNYGDETLPSPSPSPSPRDKFVLRTPSPPKLACDDIRDGARTPPTPEGGFASIFRENPPSENNGAHTSGSPEGVFPEGVFPEATTEEKSHVENDRARTPPPTGSNSLLPDTGLFNMEEEEDSTEGNSYQTVIHTPQKPSNKATALLAAMTPDNLRAADIPNFTATRTWAGDDNESGPLDDDLERTITPRTFRRAELSRCDNSSALTPSKDQDSDDSLRAALFASPVHQSMDLTTVAEPVADEADKKFTTASDGGAEEQAMRENIVAVDEDSKPETEAARFGESLSSPVIFPGDMLNQAGHGQESRVSSGETMIGSNEESEGQSQELFERLWEETMTPRSSLSSQAIDVFPRRRSDQTAVIPPRDRALSGPRRRHFSCPVNHHVDTQEM